MEGTAPAPAAAPSATNGANGPQGSGKPNAPKPTETTLGRSAPGTSNEAKRDAVRGADGKFVTADSGTARKPEGTDEPPKEAYRFKRKLKDGDSEEEVDLDEEGIFREVSIARAAKRRLGEINRRLKEMDEREAKLSAAEKDPLSYLRERGADPEAIASQLLAQKAQRGLMSPEEQRIAQLEGEKSALEQKWQKHEQEQATKQQTELEDAQWKQEEPQYLAEMERLRMPKNMAVLGFMAKVGNELTESLGSGVPPAVVVAETNDRLGQFAEHYLLSLPVEALVAKLGPERTKAIQQLLLSRWRASQSAMDPAPTFEPKPPPPEPSGERKHLTEADVDARIRQLNAKHSS